MTGEDLGNGIMALCRIALVGVCVAVLLQCWIEDFGWRRVLLALAHRYRRQVPGAHRIAGCCKEREENDGR